VEVTGALRASVFGAALIGDLPQLMQLLLLAFGGALLVGNVAALVKPPPRPKGGSLQQAPRNRTIAMAAVGLVVSLWALASLLA
jgi:hypothetical protein